MKTFGGRLKEERERLGFNQTEFAELGGVKKLAQINYEKDERQPSSGYLGALSEHGVDVMYVLTGQRTNMEYSLNRKEEALLDNYRHCVAEDQAAIYRVALSASKKEQDDLKKSG